MSTRKVLQVMGGFVIALAATFPDALSFFKQIVQFATANPVRAVLLALGLILIISAFWEHILDAAGIHSNERLLTKISSWLHFTFGYSLIETTRQENSFTVIAEHQGRRYTITKDGYQPVLTISTHVISGDVNIPGAIKDMILNTSIVERCSLKEDLAIELAQLDLDRIQSSFRDGVFEASVASSVVLSKDFDQFRLMEGISTVRRAALITTYLYEKWVRQRLPQSQTEQSK
jgi:hypothetical protein